MSKKNDEPRINGGIIATKLRVIGADGEMLGVLSVEDAIAAARSAGLDLVEVSPNAEPPVCKILDYGKYKYQAQKRAREVRKKQTTIKVKEVKMRPNIEAHDLQVKLSAAQGFLESGDKVKFTVTFRGRQMAHKELGGELLTRIREHFGETIRVEQEAKSEGRTMFMIIQAV